MKCPKCGGEIPFYDIKPNCRHCGVNILYYTQDYLLERDAKRAELESAVARMVVAKLKAVTIGSLLAILRMVFIVGVLCAMMIPFASVSYSLPLYEEKLSIGLLGLINAFTGGLLLSLPDYLKSTLLGSTTLAGAIVLAFFAVIILIDLIIIALFVLSFLMPDKSARMMRNMSIAGCAVSLLAQIAVVVCNFKVSDLEPFASFAIGFGALACFALHLILVIINSGMLKKGVEPVYREFDPKRKELLKKVKKGEVDIDELTLPVFESKEEHEARMKEFKRAMEEEEASEQ